MKNKFLYSIILLTIMAASCSKKKDFTVPPVVTLDTFYRTDAQVKYATGKLYNAPWFSFNDKAIQCIGDILSGNAYTEDPAYAPYLNFSMSSTDPRLSEAWTSFYQVFGSANDLISIFEAKKLQGGNLTILNPGIAEAKFIRGTAVFYLARVWGDVPILVDSVTRAQSGIFTKNPIPTPRYMQKDLLLFAIKDLQNAENNLPETADKGRVTKYSAKGMMAKVYLYEKDYANAKIKAGEVIASGKYDLFNDYQGMFSKSVNNNNIESLFALQWVISPIWGTQNSAQAYLAPSNLLITSDGWAWVIPSIDLLRSYEPDDKRRKWSIMEQGNYYPDWKPTKDPTIEDGATFNSFMANGYIYDTGSTPALKANAYISVINPTRSNFSKYVVGPGSATEPVQKQKTQINTYLLRYADVLLIYAESVLGGAGSTSDASALAAFNKVHQSAGLPAIASLTEDMILHERRVEFAGEGDYWFDIQRQGYAKAQQIVAAQERGYIDYTQPGGINSLHVTLTLPYNQLYQPIPLSAITANPELSKPPVPYYK